MNLRTPLCALITTGLLMARAALAADLSNDSAYADISALGLGFGGAVPLDANWQARVMLASGLANEGNTKLTINGIKYQQKLTLDPNAAVVADWFPAGHGLRFTLGMSYIQVRSKLTGEADDSGNYAINHDTYASSQVGDLTGKTDFNKLAPYLAVGWESGTHGQAGLRFVSELGAAYFSSPSTATLSASNASAGSALASDVAAQEQELSKQHGLILALSLGAAYRF